MQKKCQATENFLLRFQSNIFLESDTFCDEAKECLKRNGLTTEFYSSFAIHHASYLEEEKRSIPFMKPQVQANLLSFIENETGDADPEYTRVATLKRYNMRLTSAAAGTRDVDRNDTYIRVNENDFGEIAEIVELDRQFKTFVIVLRKFKKTELLSSSGATVTLPINHFPFTKTDEYVCFTLNRSLFIQKGVYCAIQFTMKNEVDDCLSFRPNEDFSM